MASHSFISQKLWPKHAGLAATIGLSEKPNVHRSGATGLATGLVWPAFALALATFAVHSRAVTCGFVNLDDVAYVTQTPEVHQGLTWESLRWALTAQVAANWHPLTIFSHLLDVELYGLNPAGHHLTSVAWHTANSVLLFWVLARLTGRPWPSILVAALFAWHPLHVESVAWVSERKDVLSTFFWFAAIASYTRFARHRRWGWYAATMVLFGLGLLAKPMLVTLPCTLLLLDIWPLRRLPIASIPDPPIDRTDQQSAGPSVASVFGNPTPSDTATSPHKSSVFVLPRRLCCSPFLKSCLWLVVEKIPLFAISAAFSLITLGVQRSVGAVRAFEDIPWTVRLQNAVITYIDYLWQAAWPTGLVVYYPHPGNTVSLLHALAAGSLLLGITATVVWQAGRRPYLLVGWLWYLGTLVPVIGLIQVGDQARADRYTYVPLVGIFIMVAWFGAEVLHRQTRWKPWATMAICVWLAALAGLTWRQIGIWHDSQSLFQHALAAGPRPEQNWLAHYCLGEALQEQGSQADALQHFEQAARANPRLGKPFFKIGEIHLASGNLEEAAHAFRAALRSNHPQRRLAAHNNLARCYLQMGRLDDAEAAYRQALTLAPASVAVRLGLIETLLKKGEMAVAASVAQDGLRYAPNEARLLDRLAWIRATARSSETRNGNDAVRLARRACELTNYGVPQMLDTLAAAYAEQGNFDTALQWATQALRQIDASINAYEQPSSDVNHSPGAETDLRPKLMQLRQQIAEHVRLFQQRRPIRS